MSEYFVGETVTNYIEKCDCCSYNEYIQNHVKSEELDEPCYDDYTEDHIIHRGKNCGIDEANKIFLKITEKLVRKLYRKYKTRIFLTDKQKEELISEKNIYIEIDYKKHYISIESQKFEYIEYRLR